jgi:hypothetical protein
MDEFVATSLDLGPPIPGNTPHSRLFIDICFGNMNDDFGHIIGLLVPYGVPHLHCA